MKPCSAKRKQIALLALNELDPRLEQDLRHHIESCAGCRDYCNEMIRLTKQLGSAEVRMGIETSERFHAEVVSKLELETSVVRFAIRALRRQFGALEAVALPVAGAAAVAGLLLILLAQRPTAPTVPPSAPTIQASATIEDPIDPTVFNYQRAANRSLDQLDAMLTLQARRSPWPAPVYSASSRSIAMELD